jgi:LPS export ABC transporter protein LptC
MHMAAKKAAILTCAFMWKVNRKFLKTLSVLFILAAISYGGYRWLRGTDLTMPSIFVPASGSRMLMSMEGFRFSQVEKDGLAWHVQARKADLFESKVARLQDVEISFITTDRRQGELIGETGTLDTETGNAALRGVSRDVRVVTSDGYLLTTTSLFWNADERLVRTPDPFKLLGSEIYLEGKGFSANLDLYTMMVKGNVKAVLQE